ncbi:MAG: histidine phosphatase family protein [Myxococcota bacterium]
MPRLILAGTLLTLLGAADAFAGQALKPRLEGQALIEALRGGGHTILMRHMATEPVAPDPALFDLRDCSTQRGLSDKGREQARLIAKSFARLGIAVGQVRSSPYCRCLETGRLAFGRVTEDELLSVGDFLSVPEKSERGNEVRKLLAEPPAAGGNSVLITHTGTLLYSFGLDSRPEGIAHVFKRGPAGNADYIGRLVPEDWPALAGIAAAE